MGRPKPLQKFLPAESAGYLRHFENQIERSGDELEQVLQSRALPRPHWDPLLAHNRSTRHAFFQKLVDHGLLSFRRKRKACIGIFFVHKKSGDIRLIVDARQANACHRPPPKSRLGSVGAIAELDLSSESWEALCAASGSNEPLDAHGGDSDVDDSFYQFSIAELASWFCIDELLDPLAFGVQRVWDDDQRKFTPVVAGERMYPAFEAMAMGWTWALHFCYESVAKLAEQGLEDGSGGTRLLREKVKPPRLGPGAPVAAVYVDNYTALGGTRTDAQSALDGFKRETTPSAVGIHGTSVATKYFDSLGVDFDLNRRTLRHKPRRIWKVVMAGRALAQRRRVHLCQLEAWVGHIVNIFSLSRPCLACLRLVYPFMERLRLSAAEVPWGVRAEILLCCDMAFLVEQTLGSDIWPEVTCTDSSGFA